MLIQLLFLDNFSDNKPIFLNNRRRFCLQAGGITFGDDIARPMAKKVVILVDNKKRDLPGAALIAHHLEQEFNLEPVLQPLEAWRACLGLRPAYILFNHLVASHLARFSNRLRDLGILVGVLPNEGIYHSREILEFNAGKYHRFAHIDQFFCWNEEHRQALLKIMGLPPERVLVVGVPRFDYYFAPWRQAIEPVRPQTGRERLLACTNFVFAQYLERPPEEADKFFRIMQGRLPSRENYWELIRLNAAARDRFFTFMEVLLRETGYLLDVKPHPGEDQQPYLRWYKKLPPAQRSRVTLRLTETIFEVLPLCDLEISCERCTTALEAWLLGKPTIELAFFKHPVFYDEETARCNRVCEDPAALPELVRRELAAPAQQDLEPARRELLAWACNAPRGDSAYQVAAHIAAAVAAHPEPAWSRLTWQDYRRTWKLQLKNALNLPYGSKLWRLAWNQLPGVQPFIEEAKAITPALVRRWRDRLRRLPKAAPPPGATAGLQVASR